MLLPMISTVGEVQQVRTVVARVQRRLKRRQVETGNLPPIGIMIEVPGAALAADAGGRIDFFAVGTNDLIAHLGDRPGGRAGCASLRPAPSAVLRLIQFSAQAASGRAFRSAFVAKWRAIRDTALLLGLGVRELSMSSANLPRVKERPGPDLMASTRRAEMIMDQADSSRIEMLLDDFNELA